MFKVSFFNWPKITIKGIALIISLCAYLQYFWFFSHRLSRGSWKQKNLSSWVHLRLCDSSWQISRWRDWRRSIQNQEVTEDIAARKIINDQWWLNKFCQPLWEHSFYTPSSISVFRNWAKKYRWKKPLVMLLNCVELNRRAYL